MRHQARGLGSVAARWRTARRGFGLGWIVVLAIGLSVTVASVAATLHAPRAHTASRLSATRQAAPRSPSELTATPAQAGAGSTLSLTGSSLRARTSGTVSLGGVRLARVWADRNGNWTGRVHIPSHTRAGQTRLRLAVGTSSIAARFDVTQSATAGLTQTSLAALSTGEWIRLSSIRVTAGASVALQATGFLRRATVEAWLGSRRLATWKTSRSGGLGVSLAVPGSTRTGRYTLSIRSGGHRLNLSMAVISRPAPPPPPAFTAASPPSSVTENTNYSYVFAASGRPAPTFALAGAPSWLSIDPQSGALSGTPPTGSAGTSVTYSVTATNSNGTATAGPFTISIESVPAFTASSPPTTANEGAGYTYTLAATGQPAPAFALAAGAPSWLGIDAHTGRLSGTPPVGSAGTTISYSVAATNHAGTATAGPFTITIGAVPSFTTASPPSNGAVGMLYTYTFQAVGNPTPTYALAPGAPSGMSINSTTGNVSWTPQQSDAGTSVSYTVTATNGRGTGTAGPFTVAIPARPTVTIPNQTITTQAAIPPLTPTTTGQVTGFSWSGKLPPGLGFNSTTGTFTGTPSLTGSYTTTVTASGPGGTASTSFTWTVINPSSVDAVGDMACSASDPNYNGGLGVPNATSGNDCLQQYVSDLVVNAMPSAFLDLGDNQYDTGSLSDYQTVYGSTFGGANGVSYPSLGNAEYNQGASSPTGFFSYFGGVGVLSRIQNTAGTDTSHLSSDGYYSFNVGTWHLIALNSNCSGSFAVGGGCGAGSPEDLWLKNDLKNNTRKCILAYWHHPLFDPVASESAVQTFWNDLYNAGATLVLNGHGNHHYERYAPQDPTGAAQANGIRQFVVSTGGESHGKDPGTRLPNSQVANFDTFGVLRLTLYTGSYSWQFMPASDGEGTSFADSGSGTCS